MAAKKKASKKKKPARKKQSSAKKVYNAGVAGGYAAGGAHVYRAGDKSKGKNPAKRVASRAASGFDKKAERFMDKSDKVFDDQDRKTLKKGKKVSDRPSSAFVQGIKASPKIYAGSKTVRAGAKGAAVGAAAEGGYILYKKRTKGGKSITVKRRKTSKRKKK